MHRQLTLTAGIFVLATFLSSSTVTAQSDYFGMPHTVIGDAMLSPASGGGLAVSNIGSSGQDGVSIDLGRTTGFAIRFDPGQSGSLAIESRDTLKTYFETGDIPCETQFVLEETNGGQGQILFSYSGVSAKCVRVELMLDDIVVASRVHVVPVNDPPLLLAVGELGSDGVTPMTCEQSVDSTSMVCGYFKPTDGTLRLALADPQFPCDEVRITLEGMPTQLRSITQCDVLCANLPNGTLVVTAESLKIKHKGWDGLIYHRATGSASMTGICGPDICAGCPECCDFGTGASALRVVSGTTISNIGSSGQDGVSVFCRNWGSPWFFPDIELLCSPIGLDQPSSSLVIHATGTYSDMTSRPTECRASNNAGTGAMDVSADFSSMASFEASLHAYMGGSAAGSVTVPNGPGMTLCSLSSGSGLPLHVVRCSSVAGSSAAHTGFALHFDGMFVMVAGGQAFLGDELHVLASDSSVYMEVIESLSMLGTDIAPFTVSGGPRQTSSGGGSGGSVYVFGGLEHTATGQAVIDSHPYGYMMISNIGSSGQDGVSVDLGQAQGAAMKFAYDGMVVTDTFNRVEYDIYDDQCPMCPAGVVASMDVVPISPTETELSAHRRDQCCCCNVTLVKFNGESDTIDVQDDALTIEVDPGTALAISEVSGHVRLGNPLLNELVIGMQCEVAQSPRDPGSPGVTVTHPVHGSFTGVTEIIMCGVDDSGSIGTIDRSTLTVTARNDPDNVCTLVSAPVQFDHVHVAQGQAQLVLEDCDDADDDFAPSLWLANIGSTGNDGVSIELPTHDEDDDCDGLDDEEGRVIGASVGHARSGETSFAAALDSVSWSVSGRRASDPPSAAVSSLMGLIKERSGSPWDVICPAPGWTAQPVTLTITARDQFDNIIAQVTEVPPGPVCTVDSNDDAGTYTGSFTFTATATLAGTESTASDLQILSWPNPVSMQLQGLPPVLATTIEVVAEPASPEPGIPQLHSLDVHGQSSAKSPPGFMRIVDVENIHQEPAPLCPADVAPIPTDGSVGIADLLAVIGSWGACPLPCTSGAATTCQADVNKDCQVGIADLLGVIGSWGPCLN